MTYKDLIVICVDRILGHRSQLALNRALEGEQDPIKEAELKQDLAIAEEALKMLKGRGFFLDVKRAMRRGWAEAGQPMPFYQWCEERCDEARAEARGVR